MKLSHFAMGVLGFLFVVLGAVAMRTAVMKQSLEIGAGSIVLVAAGATLIMSLIVMAPSKKR